MKWLLRTNVKIKLLEQLLFFSQVYAVHVFLSRTLDDSQYALIGIGLLAIAIVDTLFYYGVILPLLKTSKLGKTEVKLVIFWYLLIVIPTSFVFSNYSIQIATFLSFSGVFLLLRKLLYIANIAVRVIVVIDLLLLLRLIFFTPFVSHVILVLIILGIPLIYTKKFIRVDYKAIPYAFVNLLSGKIQMLIATLFFSSASIAIFFANRTVANLGNVALELMPVLILPYYNREKRINWNYFVLIVSLILFGSLLLVFGSELLSALMKREIRLSYVLPMIYTMPFILLRRVLELRYRLVRRDYFILLFFLIISCVYFGYFEHILALCWVVLPFNMTLILLMLKNGQIK
jgi:hypothetical protein